VKLEIYLKYPLPTINEIGPYNPHLYNSTSFVKMGFFSSLGSSLKKSLKKVGDFVEDTAKTVYSAAKPAVNQVYSDGKSVVSFVGNQIDKTGDTYRGAVSNLSGSAGSLISNVGEGVKDVGQSFGTIVPGIAGSAAILGGVYLYANSGSGKRQYSRSAGGSNKRTKYNYGL
jgi:phage-related protein